MQRVIKTMQAVPPSTTSGGSAIWNRLHHKQAAESRYSYAIQFGGIRSTRGSKRIQLKAIRAR